MYEDAPGTGNVSLNVTLVTTDASFDYSFTHYPLYNSANPHLQGMTDSTIRSTYINAGKFASLSSIDGTQFAFKTVLSDSPSHREELMMEFWILVTTTKLRCLILQPKLVERGLLSISQTQTHPNPTLLEGLMCIVFSIHILSISPARRTIPSSRPCSFSRIQPMQ